MRKILTVISALYPEYSVTAMALAVATDVVLKSIGQHELNDNETLVIDIRKDDFQVKKILKPKVFPRRGFKEIRRLDKLVGVRLYLRAAKWFFKILEYL